MNIRFAPRGIVEIDDARIIYRNFTGEGSKFNREGDRNFAVVIPDEIYETKTIINDKGDEEIVEVTIADALVERGWNVKIKPGREEGEPPFMLLPVKVKFNDRGPAVYLTTGNKQVRLEEDTVHRLDRIDILGVDLDIRPYDWEVNGKEGRTAYLQSIHVVQNVDRFAARYEADEYED